MSAIIVNMKDPFFIVAIGFLSAFYIDYTRDKDNGIIDENDDASCFYFLLPFAFFVILAFLCR